MISYLSIPDGELAPGDTRGMSLELAEIVMAHYIDIQLLQPGVIDVTPAIWGNNSPRHELTVLENGEGVYRLLPRGSLADRDEYTRPGIVSLLQRSRLTNINEDHPQYMIIGGHPRKIKPQIFGIIGHLSTH